MTSPTQTGPGTAVTLARYGEGHDTPGPPRRAARGRDLRHARSRRRRDRGRPSPGYGSDEASGPGTVQFQTRGYAHHAHRLPRVDPGAGDVRGPGTTGNIADTDVRTRTQAVRPARRVSAHRVPARLVPAVLVGAGRNSSGDRRDPTYQCSDDTRDRCHAPGRSPRRQYSLARRTDGTTGTGDSSRNGHDTADHRGGLLGDTPDQGTGDTIRRRSPTLRRCRDAASERSPVAGYADADPPYRYSSGPIRRRPRAHRARAH
jgi:hypothetical protein